MKLSSKAPSELVSLYGGEVGELVASEMRDGESFVSVQFPSVEIACVPAEWFEVTE